MVADDTLSSDERETIRRSHPIAERNYKVLTPTIENTYKIIRDRVGMRRTGALLYAAPRTGKTMCASIVEVLLNLEFDHTYVIRFTADSRGSARNDVAIVRDILEGDGLIFRTQKYQDLLSKLIIHIKTMTNSIGGNQFVLIIDEMQMLSEDDYRVLLVLQNRLELHQISMTTIGFAQPEILERISAMIVTKALNLIARFLCEPIQFEGCNESDIKNILSVYDNEKRYPEESQWTYTRFYFPQAYEAGFRLANFERMIWEALSDATRPLGTVSIPMEYLTRTIEYILIANTRHDSPFFLLNKSIVESAVRASGLEIFSGLMST
ncbi:MAG: ATP-binding protein [Pseudomonadota bacterium]|nr:ATP-binding protein [Pseudomonadota bacterium]